MAKKTSIKVRLVPEQNRIVAFIIMLKTYSWRKGKKTKLKLKKYNPETKKHEWFIEKKLPPYSK